MPRYDPIELSLPWLAAVALVLCAQGAVQAEERFTLSIPGVSDDRLFTAAAASDANTCGGKNISPALSWNAGPPGTLSYAIVMLDPDGQRGQGVDHWIHYGIKASTRQIPAGAGTKSSLEGMSGINSKNTHGYIGPCPPVGDSAHHYLIQLFRPGPAAGSPARRPHTRPTDGKKSKVTSCATAA